MSRAPRRPRGPLRRAAARLDGRPAAAPRRALPAALMLAAGLALPALPVLAAPPPEGTERIGLVADGLPRSALVEAPAEPAPTPAPLPGAKAPAPAPLPTLLLLHDMGQTPAQVRALADLHRAMPFRDWLLVYPEGGSRSWNAGRRRVDGGEALRTPDVAFLKALVAKLAAERRADPARIYLAGFGEGGAMALRLVCEAPGLAAGVAVVAGTWPASLACAAGRAVPAMLFNGTADPMVPFDGGQAPSVRKVGAGAMASVARTASSLAALNGCGAPMDEPPKGPVRRRVWYDCAAGILQWRIEGAGHRWPGAPDQGRPDDGFGPPAPAPDATVLIAAYFVSLAEGPRP